MFWFDKQDDRALFVDKRCQAFTYRNGDKKRDYKIDINPDMQVDFTSLPFPANTFSLVVFDPPHFSKIGETSFTAKKYGKLPFNWRDMLRKGFAECFRVLRQDGVLVFKWCEFEIPLSDILALTPEKPLFGNRYGKSALSHWIVFLKPTPKGAEQNWLFN